jgi:hypothetical protein
MEKLYLTERQDIVGAHENRSRFAQLLVDYGSSQAPDDPWQQIGTWILVGMTGRWQRTIALWEWADGWDGFSSLVAETMIRPRPALAGLYAGIDELRSGGEDFVLAPGPGCPSLADLLAAGVRGSLLSYETVHVRPGTEEEYLDAVRTQWQPVAEGFGYSLVGNYYAALTDGVVFTAWACERAQHVGLARSGKGRDWRRTAREWTTSWQEELWISAPGSRLAGPETAARF